MYWDINRTLSYNRLFNFVVGQRGNGKTYGSKVWALKRFDKTGEEFIYLRRYEAERELVGPKYCKDIQDLVFSEGRTAYVDKSGKKILLGAWNPAKERYENVVQAGHIMSLTKMTDLKSMSFPDVGTIIYDEFLLENTGVHHYLKEEPRVFLNFYETIARMRDVRVFFLANAISVNNPYFSYFKLHLPFGTNITTKNEILLELVENKEFTEAKKATRFGSIIAGTKYEEYSVENKFVYDLNSFIGKPTGNLNYVYTMVYCDKKYGFWEEGQRERGWLTRKIDPSCKMVFATTTEDHEPNRLLLDSPKVNWPYELMLKYHRYGLLWFDCLETKADFIKMAGL